MTSKILHDPPPLRRLAHRLLVGVLTTSFVLNSALPGRAQSVDMPAPAATSGAASPEAALVGEPQDSSSDATSGETAASTAAAEATSPTEVTATVDEPDPKKAAKPDPAPFSGSYSRSVRLGLPTFRDLTPAIDAVYDSNGGWHAGEFDAGFLGIGWRLDGFSEIRRAGSRNGTPRFDTGAVLESSDVYRLDGVELTRCTTASDSPSCRTGTDEIGNFEARWEDDRRIRYDTTANAWTVWAKDGTKSVYRSVSTWATSFGSIPADVTERFRWRLAEVIDTHGNTVSYDYDCRTLPTCWPSRIAYGPYEVILRTEANPTPLRHATGKTLALLDRRLRSVEVRVAGSAPERIKAWRFDHATSPATGLPRLSGIVEFGRDAVIAADGDVTGPSLPPTTFGYSATTAPTMQPKTSGPNVSPGVLPGSNTLLFGDFDGDGSVDGVTAGVFPATERAPTKCRYGSFEMACGTELVEASVRVLRFTKGPRDAAAFYFPNVDGPDRLIGFAQTESGPVTCDLHPDGRVEPVPGVDTPSHPIDYFGDGTAALLSGSSLSHCGRSLDASSPVGTSKDWARDHALKALIDARSRYGHWPKIGDFDGDGREDVVSIAPRGWDTTASAWRFHVTVYRADGDGWSIGAEGDYLAPTPASYAPSTVVGDIDGDGLTDILIGSDRSTNWTLLHSTGTGFAREILDTGVTVDLSCNILSAIDAPCLRIEDLDENGLPEILVRSPVAGTSRARFHLLSDVGATVRDLSWSPIGGNERPDVVADVDGDGRKEVFAAPGKLYYPHGEYHALSGPIPDLLTSVTTPHGGHTTIAYAPSTRWTNTLLRQIRQTVVSVTEDDGRGTTATTGYTYAGGLYDPVERRFLGFRTVTETLPAIEGEGEGEGPRRIYTFRQDLAAAGRIEKLEVFQSGGLPLRTVRHAYDATVRKDEDDRPLHFRVREAAVETTDYDRTGAMIAPDGTFYGLGSRVSRTEYDQDIYGNVVQERRRGRLDTNADDRIVRRTFPAATGDYIVGLKSAETLTELVDGVTTYRAKVYALYDGAGSYTVPPTKGDVTRLLRWSDETNAYVTRRYAYDAWGNRIREADETGNIDVAERRTEVEFDPDWHLFPVRETTPADEFGLRLVTERAWNVRCGKPSSITDPNDAVTTTTHDRFCRVETVTKPLGDYETWSYTTDPVAGWTSRVETPAPTGQTAELFTETRLDGLGRTVTVETAGPSADVPIVVDTGWDERGNKARETLPRYGTATPRTRSFRFDALARPILTIEPDGAETAIDYGLSGEPLAVVETTVTDPNGNVAVTHADAFGRDVRRDRVLDATRVATTRITRDALGRVTTVVDPIGAVWTNTWDSLGRRRAATDPDLGTWTYDYDFAGRLTRQQDARGDVVTLAYDRLGRLLTRTVTKPGGTAEVARTVWDEARPGAANLGRISREANADARICRDHDLAGRVVAERWTLPADTAPPCGTDPAGSESFTLTTTFDATGRVVARGWPDGDLTGTAANPDQLN